MPTRNTRGSWVLSVPVTLLTTITGEPIPAPGAVSASNVQKRRAASIAAAGRPAACLPRNLAIGKSEQAPAGRSRTVALFRVQGKSVSGRVIPAGERNARDHPAGKPIRVRSAGGTPPPSGNAPLFGPASAHFLFVIGIITHFFPS